ncbi:NnrS family protein [Pollutimonas thiosulfatoxidans]|uniref:NnrS family protein n=1 Tax=Pollutimonas thiosulfatoxidans TaxID=2028345 RepID=A0A410G8I3_9BURK|nr:NnrS family protein [Pollutimonas thiosulfatoxidans]QAA92515.1 NnrS family protein [Pollutimonas thiosulfatoxidans]
MTDLTQARTPQTAAGAAPDLQAFLSLGFRPLYIAGCAWALIAIALWIFAPQWLGQPLGGVAWHAHEMLWGFIATIAVGFLLTASATWTGFNPLKGAGLAGLCVLWVVARLGLLFGGETGFHIACASVAAFFLISAVCLLRVMLKGNSRRNYGVPVLVLGLGLTDVLFLRAALAGDYILLMQRFNLGLICMAVIALLIARRVIPFFSMRMVPGLTIPMQTRSGQVQLALSVLAILLGAVQWAAPMAAALAATGLIALWQTIRWQPLAVRHKPLLWILYIGYAAMGVGLIAAGMHIAGLGTGVLQRSAAHVHIIGMGGFAVLIIGMVTRTALGHLGRPLVLDGSMLLCYWLMIAAVVLRLAALWPSGASLTLLQAAAVCWMGCMALYLWRFVPLLIRPRAK